MTACPGGLSSLNRRPNHPLIPTAPPVTNYGPSLQRVYRPGQDTLGLFSSLCLSPPHSSCHSCPSSASPPCFHSACLSPTPFLLLFFFFFLSRTLVKAKGTARLISILIISSPRFEQISCLKPSRLMPLLLARI